MTPTGLDLLSQLVRVATGRPITHVDALRELVRAGVVSIDIERLHRPILTPRGQRQIDDFSASLEEFCVEQTSIFGDPGAP